MQDSKESTTILQSSAESLPDLLEALKAIDRVRGLHTDKTSQNDFLQGLIEKKHGTDLSERVMADTVRDFRKKLGERVRNNARYHAKFPYSKQRTAYVLADFWVLGQQVMNESFLMKHHWDISPDEEADDDPDDVEEVPAESIRLSISEASSRSGKRKGKNAQIAKAETGQQPPKAACRETAPENVQRNLSTYAAAQSMTGGQRQNTPDSIGGVRRNSSTATKAPGKRTAEAAGIITQKQQRLVPEAHQDTAATAPVIHAASTAAATSTRPHEISSEAAHSESPENWARQAGFRNMPALLPTRKPANPQDIIGDGDQVWLTAQMDALEKAIWNCMLSFFQEHRIDPNVSSIFIQTDSGSQLSQLYDTMFGQPEWRVNLVNLEIKGVVCRQDYAFTGLLGAGIYHAVFQSRLPWEIRDDRTFGQNRKYFEAVFKDLGHSIETVLQYVAGKQIADESFQQEDVKEHAHELTGALATILVPHMKLLVKAKATPETLQFKPWQEYLQKAFTQAIIVKQTLTVSKLGIVACNWPAAGVRISGDHHRPLFEALGATRVLHTVLPRFIICPRGDVISIARAVVIPLADTGSEQ
ncbi:hypothetical protein DOTSEDRAFT_78082 [Dothistroma septosporum NZE10]|uniref:Uncharacterized protein n=1 Tax=Dothistroma septosporum (strain NZE10 / CBS 128990) TaxID=675120 RepID=N1PY59_DOTSN|nr:hypothetical protein DOTSEDRAFT_78082 [Dothistroma septosporum NZE10]